MAIQRRDNLCVFGPIIAELKKKKKNTLLHTFIHKWDHLRYSACIDICKICQYVYIHKNGHTIHDKDHLNFISQTQQFTVITNGTMILMTASGCSNIKREANHYFRKEDGRFFLKWQNTHTPTSKITQMTSGMAG